MKKVFFTIMTASMLFSCGGNSYKSELNTPAIEDFQYKVEEFADISILRYRVPDIENLTTKQKELLYYLTEAALQGRDILFDQNFKHNLPIRKVLEAIYLNAEDKTSDNFKALELYLKQVWVANGIHHHYSGDKFVPEFTFDYFEYEFSKLPEDFKNSCFKKFTSKIDIIRAIFEPEFCAKRINQAAGVDLILTSAMNYYDGVTQQEAEDFYDKMKDPNDLEPISYGLNSKLVKKDGKIYEDVYKVGGLYSDALKKVV